MSLAFILFAAPLIASAQALTPLKQLVSSVGSILNLLIPVLIAAAIVVFFWGLVMYIRSSGEGHGEGRNVMIAGILSLFIMVSIWGLVNLVQNSLGVSGNASVTVPQVPVQ